MKDDKIIRITYTTYVKMRNLFPAREKESAEKYFQRLIRYLE